METELINFTKNHKNIVCFDNNVEKEILFYNYGTEKNESETTFFNIQTVDGTIYKAIYEHIDCSGRFIKTYELIDGFWSYTCNSITSVTLYPQGRLE